MISEPERAYQLVAQRAAKALEVIDPGSQHNVLAESVLRMQKRLVNQSNAIEPSLSYILIGTTESFTPPEELVDGIYCISFCGAAESFEGLPCPVLGDLLFRSELAVVTNTTEGTCGNEACERVVAILSQHMATVVLDAGEPASETLLRSTRQRSASAKGNPLRIKVEAEMARQGAGELAALFLMRLGPLDRRAIRNASQVLHAQVLSKTLHSMVDELRREQLDRDALQFDTDRQAMCVRKDELERERRQLINQKQAEEDARVGHSELVSALQGYIKALQNAEQAWPVSLGLNPLSEANNWLKDVWKPKLETALRTALVASVAEPDKATPTSTVMEVELSDRPSDKVWNWLAKVTAPGIKVLNPTCTSVSQIVTDAWRELSHLLARVARQEVTRTVAESNKLDLAGPRVPEWFTAQLETKRRAAGVRARHISSAAECLHVVEVPRRSLVGAVAWGVRILKPNMMIFMVLLSTLAAAGGAAVKTGHGPKILYLLLGAIIVGLIFFPIYVRYRTRNECEAAASEMAEKIRVSLYGSARELLKLHVTGLLEMVNGAVSEWETEWDGRVKQRMQRVREIDEELRGLKKSDDFPSILNKKSSATNLEDTISDFDQAITNARRACIDGFAVNVDFGN